MKTKLTPAEWLYAVLQTKLLLDVPVQEAEAIVAEQFEKEDRA